MKIRLYCLCKFRLSLVAGLGGILAVVNLAPAQPWSAVDVPGFAWRTVAASADFTKLVGAGTAEMVYGFDGVGPIYLSMDSGLTWIRTAAPSNSWSTVAASADGSTMVAAAAFQYEHDDASGYDLLVGNLIYTSTDFGLTWNPTTAPTNNWVSVASSADGSKLVAGSASIFGLINQVGDGLIYISGDSGRTWSQTTAPSNYWMSVTSSADGSKLAAVGDGLIYRSTNSGINWIATSAPRNAWSSIASSTDGMKLAATAQSDGSTNFNPGLIYVSEDAGLSWTQSTAPSNHWFSVTVSADASKLIAGSESRDIFVSTDFGATWQNRGGPFNRSWPFVEWYPSIATSADGNRMLAGAGEPERPGLLLMWPYAGRWDPASAAVDQWASVAGSEDGTRWVAAASLIYTSTNSGLSWTATSAPSNYWSSVASSTDGTRLAAADSVGQIYTSMNSGATWSRSSADVGLYSVASSADGRRLVGGGCCGIAPYTSADFGGTWTASAAVSNNWSSVASSADGIKLVAAAFGPAGYGSEGFGDGLIYTSTNAGASWVRSGAPSNNWSSVACSADGAKILASVIGFGISEGGGSIYISTNAGGDWAQAPLPFESWSSVACSSDGMEMVAVAESGQIYVSKDSGATWVWAEPPCQPWQAAAVSNNGDIVAVPSIGPIYVLGPQASPSIPTPQLEIAQSPGGLKVSWLVPSTKFELQVSSDLSSSAWATLPHDPTLNVTNLHNEIAVPLQTGMRFYRLKERAME